METNCPTQIASLEVIRVHLKCNIGTINETGFFWVFFFINGMFFGYGVYIVVSCLRFFCPMLNLVLLNKLRCHTHF